MFKEIKDEKAFDGILNQIIDNIQNGHLKAGDALPAERTMAETMGVSRPAVREVLRALELLGIIKTVPGGGNYIADDLDSWLIGPLSILFKLNNGYIRQTQQLRAALELEMAILAARKCTPLDAAELWRILSSIDKAEDEKTRGELDKELHTQIAKIADNPMIYSVLAAADQLIENIIAGTRDYIMKKNRPEFKVDEQHRLLVEAIINNDEKGAEQYMSEHMEIIEKCMDEMQKYDGKTVKFLAQVCQTNRAGKDSFVPGRFAMTCCVQDIQFVGFPCKYTEYKNLKQRDWITVTAKVNLKYHPIYKGQTPDSVGPVLTAINVEPAAAPRDDVVTFS